VDTWNSICKKSIFFILALGFSLFMSNKIEAVSFDLEPIVACVVTQDAPLDDLLRTKYAQCLGWSRIDNTGVCSGYYQDLDISPIPDPDELQIMADESFIAAEGRSELKGRVELRQQDKIINANTAYIYRDKSTGKVQQIQLLGGVQFVEPDRIIIGRKALFYPQDNSGLLEDVIYRFKTNRAGASMPAWGRATLIQRFANQDLALDKATYTTCAPQDNSWQIEAHRIDLDKSEEEGIARNALLRIHDVPVLYTPYLSFPTSKQRKSGFLMPLYGYSNVGGFDLGLPYYWNLAPNYDMTLIPHLYSRRGLMLGSDLRYLTPSSLGHIKGFFLPNDKAFNKFINDNKDEYPGLQDMSRNRWSLFLRDQTQLSENLNFQVNFQQVSDDYYLQDFSSNLAINTQNQLLRQADLSYSTEHWLFRSMVQSYQTLHPINQTPIADVYERLPQLLAKGSYHNLPYDTNFNFLGQVDNFQSSDRHKLLEGPRYHVNPIWSFPYTKPWGSITPEFQFLETYYDLNTMDYFLPNRFNRTLPRYSVDSNLIFERNTSFLNTSVTQTLEPRLFYLYVPYRDQAPIPVFDSAYMIFNYDQLFRNNRFSGFDRIGDANQLSYALATHFLSDNNGYEIASLSAGQILYFRDRKVQLCYNPEDINCWDSPSTTLGFTSPTSTLSPLASRFTYNLSPSWTLGADYVWDVEQSSTNNGMLNFHYQPAPDKILNFGYTYLVNGDIAQINAQQDQDALYQATISYGWPLTEKWSTLGAYNYNISKHYDMMAFLGLQYETCCWAVRLLGGHTFKNVEPNTLQPVYNNSAFVQIMLKGLGSVANTDPTSTIGSFLPGYANVFNKS
jgi:LPS-assembly protein